MLLGLLLGQGVAHQALGKQSDELRAGGGAGVWRGGHGKGWVEVAYKSWVSICCMAFHI